MTRILLNDEEISLDRGGATVEALLKQLSINDLERIAVAVNDNVLRRSDWASYQLEENDRVLMIAQILGG